MTSNVSAPSASNQRDSTKRTSSASRVAFAARDGERCGAHVASPSRARRAALCFDGERDRAAARADVEHGRRARALRAAASASSTSSSVSGRGISTSGDTASGSEKNSRSPVRYASGSPRARRATSATNRCRSRGLERALRKCQQRRCACCRSRCASSTFGIEPRRFAARASVRRRPPAARRSRRAAESSARATRARHGQLSRPSAPSWSA